MKKRGHFIQSLNRQHLLNTQIKQSIRDQKHEVVGQALEWKEIAQGIWVCHVKLQILPSSPTTSKYLVSCCHYAVPHHWMPLARHRNVHYDYIRTLGKLW